MGVKGLVEGIILQSFEDLWSDTHREESIAFFRGREFSLCAGMSGMTLDDQIKLLRMVKSVIDSQKRPKQEKRIEKTKASVRQQRCHRPSAVSVR